jgi:hypothetical protein
MGLFIFVSSPVQKLEPKNSIFRDLTKKSSFLQNPPNPRPVLHLEPPSLKNRSFSTADLKILKTVGEPHFRPKLL